MVHVAPPLHELHWLPVCFRIQFKVRTFKAFCGMGPGYVRKYLIPTGLACPTHSSIADMLQTLSFQEFQMTESRTKAFPTMAATFWNIVSLEARSTPLSWPTKRAWLCLTHLGLQWGHSTLELAVGLRKTSHPQYHLYTGSYFTKFPINVNIFNVLIFVLFLFLWCGKLPRVTQ